MNQRKKNIRLLIILGILIAGSSTLSIIDDSVSNTIGNKDIFSVSDTSKIDLITIKSSKESIELVKQGQTWMLGETMKAEQNIAKILLAILKDMEVSRRVPDTQKESIISLLNDKGYLIEIYANGEMIRTFRSCGNENKTVSYMMDPEDEQPYILNIPGYGSYVAGIFEIPKDDWRDRLILSTNWRSLQELKMAYTEYPEHDFRIKFGFNFLNVEGVKALDTAAMMGYIENFYYLQADKYLVPGQNNKYDSLLKTPKTVELMIQDIDKSNSKTIHFYPLLANDPMMLAYIREDEQMVLFEANRIQNIFAVRGDFAVKEENF